MTEFKPFEGK
jgi:hypothetical protein